MSKHLLVADVTGRTPRVRLAEFDTYGEAVAAFTEAEATKAEFPAVRYYAVRSADDPSWASVDWLRTHEGVWNPWHVRGAARDHVRKELRATAGSFVRSSGGGDTLSKVEREVAGSMRARGYVVTPVEVVDAVKAKVTLGRCRRETWQRGGCGRAYWFPTGQGRLADRRCPHCDRRLAQTTGALKAEFCRLPVLP